MRVICFPCYDAAIINRGLKGLRAASLDNDGSVVRIQNWFHASFTSQVAIRHSSTGCQVILGLKLLHVWLAIGYDGGSEVCAASEDFRFLDLQSSCR